MTAETTSSASDDAESLVMLVNAEVVDLEAARVAAEEDARRIAIRQRATEQATTDFAEWRESGRLDYFRWAGRMGYAAVLVEGYGAYRKTWLGLYATQEVAKQQAS